MSPTLALAILPLRHGDPASTSGADSPEALLRRAEILGIPWRRLLLSEIDAEERLRRYLSDVEERFPLRAAAAILEFASLQSWRVRDRVQTLAGEARGDSVRAGRELRGFLRRFAGRPERDGAALAEHLAFAYQRVLLLQRVCRAAARTRGSLGERLAAVCAKARCCFEDAEWAIRQEDSPDRAARLEAAVRRVRSEGFLIPRARTEARSLAELRRIVHAAPNRSVSPGDPRATRYAVSVPRRLQPSDAV